MAIENETADQVVRMILQGSEVVLKISGEAAMRIATMIYNALKGDLTTKGKATLWEFLRSGKDQKLFEIPEEYLKAFTTASKKYGFPFVVLKDKTRTDGKLDIMVYSSDAPKVSRVLDNLQLNVEKIRDVMPDVQTETGDLINAFNKELAVPLSLIDGIPDPDSQDKRLLAELQKYASRIKDTGPQVIEPVGLLCKPDGRYEVVPGQGSKRLMALRLAGYKEAVADILIPRVEGVEVKAENIEDRSPQEKSDSRKTPDGPDAPEKDAPTKEKGQTVNPTMARTSRDPASGQDLEPSSRKDDRKTFSVDPNDRPSVRKKLEKAKEISEGRQAAKELEKLLSKAVRKQNPR